MKDFTVGELEAVIDVISAPGRHVPEWDGGWNDAVAEALLKHMNELLEERRA